MNIRATLWPKENRDKINESDRAKFLGDKQIMRKDIGFTVILSYSYNTAPAHKRLERTRTRATYADGTREPDPQLIIA
jgi:hypothetical protein